MSRAFCDYVLDLLSPWGAVEARRLFGGYGLYRDNVIFAIILSGDVLYFKVTDETQPAYEVAGCLPFTYKKDNGSIVKLGRYYEVPASVMDEGDELVEWADSAYQSLRREVKPTPKKPRKKPAIS